MTTQGTTLQAGQKYRVVYRPNMARIDREMVAVYLGEEHGDVSFSGRPVWGTSTMPRGWISKTEEVNASTPCYFDRKVREDAQEKG